MSPVECRNLTTPCGVRTYSASSFDRETAAQKWDVVKIVVSQIFNKQIQFGLSFVKFTVVGDANAPQKIGAFALRKPLGGLMDEDEDDSQHSRIGAMFAKSIGNKTSNKGIRIFWIFCTVRFISRDSRCQYDLLTKVNIGSILGIA